MKLTAKVATPTCAPLNNKYVRVSSAATSQQKFHSHVCGLRYETKDTSVLFHKWLCFDHGLAILIADLIQSGFFLNLGQVTETKNQSR